MKPLFRWTMGGNPHSCGFHILEYSVRFVRQIYGDSFDYCICINGLNESQIKRVEAFGLDVIRQFHSEDMEYEPSGVAWKLYPPRLRKDAHEIFIDNDVILHKRPEIVDEFLDKKDMTFISQGYGNYGKYSSYCNSELYANSGFFGLPPNFLFAQKIKEYQKQDKIRKWDDYFDEQGLVAACVMNHYNNKLIPFADISVSDTSYNPARIGSHFVRINSGRCQYWFEYYTNHICKVL